MKQLNIIKITKVVLDVMLVLGIIGLLTLPFTLRIAGKYYSQAIMDHYVGMVFIFGVSALLGILIIYELRCMMKTVVADDCFVHRNVQSLERMGGISICISIMFIIKMFILPTPATFIIIIVFFIASLFCGVVAQVFAKAIQYKEENDLTI